jgi:hypothetical protein
LVTIGGGEADGADESEKVSHAFQPSGVLTPSSSLRAIRPTDIEVGDMLQTQLLPPVAGI